jgi:predicted RNA-binding Zn-ribbon protein involved in translation (DUF1610 family)
MGLLSDLLSALLPPPKQYGTLSVTVQGEQVKSHGEQTIADFFARNGVRYEYERPIEVGIWIFNEELCRPDFYLPDYDVYIEYWGMIDVEDGYKRREYQRKMKWKMAQYYKYDIKFISIYPRNMRNLDWVFRKKFQQVTGRQLPKQSADRRQANRGERVQEQRHPAPPAVGNERPQQDPAPSPIETKENQPIDITFECGSCGQSIVVEEAGAGLTLDCPTCGKPVYVPSKAGTASPLGVQQTAPL